MKHPVPLCLVFFLMLLCGQTARSQELYTMPEGQSARWASPENPTGAPGQGGQRNGTAKGRAFARVPAHGTLELLNTKGTGVVDRIKLTMKDLSPAMLRSMRIEMYWDGATKPAVSVPLGDFFGAAFGQMPILENVFFSDPESHSLAETIPMPYRRGARIVLINDSNTDQPEVFYDVNYRVLATAPAHMLYFHAWWSRQTPPVGEDFTILPRVIGSGRFLGVMVGIRTNPAYSIPQADGKPKVFWWGEGEVKIYLDGDKRLPSLVGTGAEDYFGTAWGAGHFVQQNAGCPVADLPGRRYSCYRFHVPDPVYFHHALRVTIQQIGGGPLDEVRQMAKAGAPLIPISADTIHEFYPLREMLHPPTLMDANFPDGWTNYFRSDDWCATAYFYLNSPVDDLPPIPVVAERVRDL